MSAERLKNININKVTLATFVYKFTFFYILALTCYNVDLINIHIYDSQSLRKCLYLVDRFHNSLYEHYAKMSH